MERKRYYHYLELQPDQLAAAIQECPIAYIPFGAMEWHGEHMALGMDGLKAEELCRRTIERTGGVLFPCVYWGAFDVMKFPYTMHGSKRYQFKLTRSSIEQLYEWGFRVFVLLTGHYPPSWIKFLRKTAKKFHKKHKDAFIIATPEHALALGLDYYGEHAAKFETAIMMSLYPDLVDLNKLPKGLSYVDRAARHGVWGFDPCIHSTAELGDRVVDAIVNRLANAVNEAWAKKSQEPFDEIYDEFNAAMKELHTISGAMKYSGMEEKADIRRILKWMILERKKQRKD